MNSDDLSNEGEDERPYKPLTEPRNNDLSNNGTGLEGAGEMSKM